MKILILKSFSLIFIQLIAYSNTIDFDEGCFLEEPAALQVAFVMDNTGTFLLGNNSFFKQFAMLAPELMNSIDKDYPGSQFALTIHADWPRRAEPPHVNNTSVHNTTEACYRRRTNFTTDRKLFQARMVNVSVLGSGKQENGLSALAFTAADSRLGWVRGLTFPNGKLVRRVLILVTDEDDLLKLDKPGGRGEFKGDGTDTCSSSKPPTHKILKEVFEKYQMTVISLLAENSRRPNLTQLYEQHFEKIGSNVKYCSRSFVIRNGTKSLWTDSELKQKDEEDGGEAAGVVNFKPLKADEVAKLSEAMAKAGEYDELIKYVKDCLRETDSTSCLFGDPEGYNTLGF